ncbi:FAD-linked oxidase C-terminal domain-containing protein [Nannocystis sp.]|uniref:FAD-binding oxidoreductase n=1 Tax=Nannocystis sp. TaxID=1962667 RepID=UPI0025DC5691|nr:FAD-linked oxidase C-terminal domain-containing protein [Nannocystis sp.]MBK7830151.1 FAD-binding protein [Nannocystis sp.]
MTLERLRERVRAALGDAVLVADDGRYARDDGVEGPFVPGLVVRPRAREEVAELVALCHAHAVPLSPRGTGTGTVGGCLADHGGVVLDLAGLDRILDIDERSLLAEVEPGVITATLHAAALARGLFYPPDPASLKKCSLGGNVATNAGGPRACKYGVTGNFVLGLDVVTGTGQPLRVGHRSIKGVTGYNLAGLLVGSEGTLAVTTAATLRLVPRPSCAVTLLASFADEADACAAVHRCQTGGVVPAALEFADRLCVRVLTASGGLAVPVPDQARALLWIEIDGDAAGLDRSIERAAGCCREAGALAVSVAGDAATRERLWDVRRALSHSLRAGWPRKVSEDVAVPLAQLPALTRAAREIGATHGLDVASFGHAGDGNLHVNILYDPAASPDVTTRVDRAVADLFRATIALGGTLSGEHGIGISKRPFMALEQSGPLRALQCELKRVWDPGNILNPGKVFPA